MTMERRARNAGLMAAVLILAVLAYSLFASPALSTAQDGTYAATLETLGLRYARTVDQSARVVERFAYADHDLGALLKLDAPSMAYPAALVRLLTEPFGQLFDTRLLACAYMLLIALGGALMVGGLYKHSRLAAIASLCGLLTLGTFTPVVGYLNSLDAVGAAVTFTVLFIGMVTFCLCGAKGQGLWPMAGVLLSAVLLLRAQAQMMVLLPFVLVILVLCFLHTFPEAGRRGVYLLLCGLMLLWCGQGVTAGFAADGNIHTGATSYLAVFQGYLPVSDDVAGDLAVLGLPADQAADVGRSYYDDPTSFAYDPRDGAEGTALLDNITLEKRIRFCLTHPERIVQMASSVENHFLDAYNDRIVTADGQTRYVRPSPLLLIDLLLPMAGSGTLAAYLLLAAALCLLCMLITPKGMWKLPLSLAMLLLGLACYLPATLIMTGLADVSMAKVMVFFLGWLGLFAAIAAGLTLGQRLMVWMSDKAAALRPESPLAAAGQGRSLPVMSRSGMVALTAVLCILLGCWLLGPESHIGGVNNGDYGRMMEQIDLYWTDDITFDLEAQMGTQVVEDYTYREPFHPERLTSLDPTYSLLFPSMLVRLWSLLTGSIFSTHALAIVLLALTVLSILLIVHDLQPMLGNLTLLPALTLTAMLLGENYLAWYNSLYGESMLSVGLIMTLACAVHLIVMPRNGKGSWRWLVLLAISVRLMTCSKAQMALALPGGLALLAGLCIYHHPVGWKKLTVFTVIMSLCAGIVCWDTWGIYKKNAGVSERQTVWQSVFYGALMIAEDPDAAMAELGVDPAMKPDIGKHAYYPDEDYVYAPMSKEADAALYDHVNTMTMVRYYLRHPADFLKMLDRAAQESVTLHTGFMAYSDESYADHTALHRFTAWMNLRPVTALRAFWQYVAVYGAGVIYCLMKLFKKNGDLQGKLLALLFLCIMCIGAFQFPLSVVGNGFADNNKQLYCFMLCHDLLVIFALTAGLRRLGRNHERRGS